MIRPLIAAMYICLVYSLLSAFEARFNQICQTMFTLASIGSSLVQKLKAKTRILLITDIGSDPDDILALLVILASNQLQVADFLFVMKLRISNAKVS